MGTFISLIGLIFWLILVPLCIGVLPARLLPEKRKTVSVTFLCGLLMSWAIFEVVAIPCMLLITYNAFTYCVRIYTGIEIVLFIAGASYGAILVKRGKRNNTLALELTGKFNFRMLTHRLEAIFPGEIRPIAEDYMNPRGNFFGMAICRRHRI